MLKINEIHRNKTMMIVNILLFLFTFIVGLMNSVSFFYFLGINQFITVLRLCFYLLLIFLLFYMVVNNLLTRNTIFPIGLPYWIILVLAVSIKFFVFFVQNPAWLLPNGRYSAILIDIITNLAILILLTGFLGSLQKIKISIIGFALGAIFSVIIPIIFLPEMIGLRISNVQGYYFSGGVWNSAVVSYISFGWLLVAASTTINSKVTRFFLISSFLIIVFGGLAGLSRAILLSIVISITIYLFLTKNLKNYIKVLLTGLIILLLIMNLFPDLFANFSNRLDGGINIEEELRTIIWLDYLEDLPSYFMIGAVDGDYTKYSETRMYPHSVILNWLVQYGILGLLGYILIIIGVLKSIKNIKKYFPVETSSALYAWLAAYLSVSLINETGFDQLTVFAGLGVILAWGYVSKVLSNQEKGKVFN